MNRYDSLFESTSYYHQRFSENCQLEFERCQFLGHSVHAEVLDFPGTITVGDTLQEARRLLASALVDMAETALLQGEPLPQPDPSCTAPEADLEEPIHLLLTAASHIRVVPQTAVP